jgi:hypothetical protein
MTSKQKIIGGAVLLFFIAIVSNALTDKTSDIAKQDAKKMGAGMAESTNLATGKELAKNMATGEVILMAACLGKNGMIPRNQMGDYIAAAVEEQGISKKQLQDNWEKYWSYARDIEKRDGTSCLSALN